jgi:hypothetical protein
VVEKEEIKTIFRDFEEYEKMMRGKVESANI